MSRFPFRSGAAFDVIVIGGGIIGAGIARDAALRGFSVALFEKADFGGGTTAGSTRLIHGGLRYLEMLDFRLVRMDLRERETLLGVAPHMVRPLEFLVPFYDRSLYFRARMRAGMLLYDALSFDRSLPGHRFLSARETLAREPQLRAQGLQGAAAYYDAQIASPERLCLENVLDARERGAVALNYAEVNGAIHDAAGAVRGVRVRDAIGGEEIETGARVVVNASGPWFDRVAARLAPHPAPLIRTTKGIHIACAPVNRAAAVLFSHLDGRLFFVIPLLGYTWIGTTDTDFREDPGLARAAAADVEYLLASARPYFPGLRAADIFWSNAGVRALVMKKGKESSISRLHRIVEAPGIISVLGGKITGYRAIAEDATDAVCRSLGVRRRCETAVTPLPGACGAPGPLPAVPEIGEDTRKHLVGLYGSRAAEVLRLAESEACLRERLSPDYPDIEAQVAFAVRAEQAVHASDVILRRTLLGFSPDQGGKALEAVARRMALELNWPPSRSAEEIRLYRQWMEETQAFRTGP